LVHLHQLNDFLDSFPFPFADIRCIVVTCILIILVFVYTILSFSVSFFVVLSFFILIGIGFFLWQVLITDQTRMIAEQWHLRIPISLFKKRVVRRHAILII